MLHSNLETVDGMATSYPLTRNLQRRAYMDGHAAGFAKAQAETVRQALEAQRKAREFVDASHDRIVAIALAAIERMATGLGPATVVTSLLTNALAKIQTERELRVNVSQSAIRATREMLAHWQREHPRVEVRVLVDPKLEPFGCVIESELGRIELGLLNPLLAAFIHVASELTFILNSARLLPPRSGETFGRDATAGAAPISASRASLS